MQRVVKPKTKRGKRYLDNRAPKLIENDKTAIFVRGVNANNVVLQAMKDFAALKKPHSQMYNRKNDIKPLEDATSLEFFCQKSDAAHFMFGSHNKKRPNNLVIGRMFNHQVLDMFELGVENFQSLNDFKTKKVALGSKPMLMFTEGFDEQPEYKRLKNLFIDFFRGPVVEYINLQGLEHLLAFSLISNKIMLRSYRVSLKKSESNLPTAELEEIGPHMDLSIRRTKLASDHFFKQACKTPLQLKPKKKKNINKDTLGSTQGRIHMVRQDYSRLQTRKMKGLKKGKSVKKKADGEQSGFQVVSEPSTKKVKLAV